MINLANLIKTIKEKRSVAFKQLNNDMEPNQMKAVVMQARRAKEDLIALELQYNQAVKAHSLFILVHGQNSSEFAQTAQNKFDCFNYKATDFYDMLISKIDPRLYMGKAIGASIFDIVNNTFENIAASLDITSHPYMIMDQKHKKTINSKEQLRDIVQEAFNKKIGSEVASLYFSHEVAVATYKDLFESTGTPKFIPIVVTIDSKELLDDFVLNFRRHFKNVVIVSIDKDGKSSKNKGVFNLKEVTEEKVQEILVKIKQSVI